MVILTYPGCYIYDHEAVLLEEIREAHKDIDIWAYGLESNGFAIEFAVHQGDCWYEIYQTLIGIGACDEHPIDEYPRLRIRKHTAPFTESSKVPFRSYYNMYTQKPTGEKLPVQWEKVTSIPADYLTIVFRDHLKTMRETENGTKEYYEHSGDIAVGFKSISTDDEFYIQVSSIPFYVHMCRHEKEMDNCYKIWKWFVSDQEEIEALKAGNHEDYYLCHQLVDFKRFKISI